MAMKKHLFTILILLFYCCNYAQLAPESFEETAFPPAGWATFQNEVGLNNTWKHTTPGDQNRPPRTGTYAAFIDRINISGTVNPKDYLVTTPFNAPANGQLRFWSRLTVNGDQGSTYQIMIKRADGTQGAQNEEAGYSVLQTWTELEINPIQQQYTQKTVSIPATYENQLVYIAFVITNVNQGDRWLIDDVDVIAECPAPTNPAVTNAGLETATLTWDSPAGIASWEIEIKNVSEPFNGQNLITYNGPQPYNAAGLIASTDYKFRVRSVCGPGNVSNWSGTINFSTGSPGDSCSTPIFVTGLPYSTTNNTSNFTDVYNGSPGATGCGVDYGYLDGNDVIYAYTAIFTGVISIDMLNPAAFAGMFVYNSCENIGVSCIAGGINEGSTNNVNIPTLQVTAGSTYYIVISTWSDITTTPYTLVIQQVNCPLPTGLSITNLNSTSATLIWDNNNYSSWEVVVQAPGNGIPQGAGTTVTTNTGYAVSQTNAGLPFTPSTTYEYYVRAACPGTATFSPWAGPFTFTTTQVTATLPYIQNFEAAQTGLTLANGIQPNKWVIGTAVNNGGSNAMYISNNNGTSNIYDIEQESTVHAYRDLLMPAGADQISISFDWKCVGDGGEFDNYDYMSVWAVPASYVPVAGTQITPGNGRVQVGSDFVSSGQWQTFNGIINAAPYSGQALRIVFEWYNNSWAGNQPPAAIDNIGVQALACSTPSALAVSNIGQTTATVSWTAPASGAASYDYYVTGTDTPPVTGTAPTGNVTATTVNLTGLTISAQYYVWVRSNCGTTGTSPWIGPANFTTTQIPANLDYTEGFEAVHNWSLVNGSQTNKWVVGTAVNNGGTHSLYISDNNGAANNYNGDSESVVHAYRDLQMAADITELGISFDWRNKGSNGSDHIKVWLVPVTFVPTPGVQITAESSGGEQIEGSFAENSTWVNFATNINATAFQGQVRRIIFEWNNDSFGANQPPAAIDNIKISVVTCTRPVNLSVTNTTLTGATLQWTEAGTAQQWQVAVLPNGSAAPAENAPEVITVTQPQYVATGLNPGTAYVFYVRSDCGITDGKSLWAGPFRFVTLVANDNCPDAITVPVNPAGQCIQDVTGTLTGATDSGIVPTCAFGPNGSDVWYQFTALATTQIISLNNQTGGSFGFVVFSGDNCGALTEIFCSGNNNNSIANLTVGQTYKVMVYPTFLDQTAISGFDICIRTPENAISVSTTQYTIPDLVNDVLVRSECVQISNIVSSTGTSFNQPQNGIGYFNKQNSTFPMPEGILLVSGEASGTEGPNTELGMSTGFPGWQGDAELENIVGLTAGSTNDATSLSFDFIPFSNTLSFDFLFASEEYGNPYFECDYSDSFAFILTDLVTNVSTNLAVLPGTNTPIKVTNIHPDNTGRGASCPGINEQYFGEYSDALLGATKFNGQTKVLTASSPIIPNHPYRIKLVIANERDHLLNSAVFIEAGSFNVGQPDLGTDLLVSTGNAVCEGDEVTLQSGSDPAIYTFEWLRNDTVISGQTGPQLTVTQAGTYKVRAIVAGSQCAAESTVTIEFYPDIETITGTPANLSRCDADGFAEFDLTQNTATILGQLNPQDYQITYHTTATDAEAGTNAIVNPVAYTNTQQGQQTIYVRIKLVAAPCYVVKQFAIKVEDLTPQFTVPANTQLCPGSIIDITLTNTNFTVSTPGASIEWSLGGTVIANNVLTLAVSQAGSYQVKVNNNGCETIKLFTVTAVAVQTARFTYGPQTEFCQGENVPLLIPTVLNTANDAIGAITVDIQGLDISQNGAINIANSAPGLYTITNTVQNQSGCPPAKTSVTIRIKALPQFNLGGPFDTCTEDGVTLAIQDAGFDQNIVSSYAWSYNGTVIGTGASVQSQGFGEYFLTVTVNGCSTTKSTFVNQNTTGFEIGFEEKCTGSVFSVSAVPVEGSFDPDTATYVWTSDAEGFTGATTQSIEPKGLGIYKVTVTTSEKCIVTQEFTVTSTSCSIQKGISPNNDGLNDSFDLSTLDVRQLSIFNRYGIEVYRFGNYTNQWQGQGSNGDELPTGTYYYMISRRNGEQLTGWIYINREE